MNRYLIYFSYIGTRFRGLQKQNVKGVPLYPDETVQSLVETAFSNLKTRPINTPIIYPASRTDQGVHALCTAAHVDLEFPHHLKSVTDIVHSLNNYFIKTKHDIRILSVHIVPDSFSARYSAVRKKYLYRLAVLKPDVLLHIPNRKTVIPMPIVEQDRCYFIYNPKFSLTLADQASRLFVGKKDFRAFMGKSGDRKEVNTERHIEDLKILKGEPLIRTPESDYFNYWDVICTGKSFLYKQVRRTVGVLIGVAQKKITLADVEAMFINPTKNSWIERVSVVPGYGLYLVNVDYREEDVLCEIDRKLDIEVIRL